MRQIGRMNSPGVGDLENLFFKIMAAGVRGVEQADQTAGLAEALSSTEVSGK